MGTVKVYGADSCADTRRTRQKLDNAGVEYEYLNVEENPDAARWVIEQNDGKERKPTVDIDGVILSMPNNAELERALRDKRYI
jgi:mycoredoxin